MLSAKGRRKVRYSIDNCIEAQTIEYDQIDEPDCYTEAAKKRFHTSTNEKLQNKSFQVGRKTSRDSPKSSSKHQTDLKKPLESIEYKLI